MLLPKEYSEKTWERGGSNPLHKQYIGKPMISWSQVEMFRKSKGLIQGLTGQQEYFLKYFTNVDTTPNWMPPFGDFGTEVEDYICFRGSEDKFNAAEKSKLETIEPLGVFQEEVIIDYTDFILLGFIDDRSPETKDNFIEIIRDYKTKSESGKKDLLSPDKLQLPLYAGALQLKGYKIGKLEYVIVERLGGGKIMRGGSRLDLTVGDRVWYENYPLNENIVQEAMNIVESTAREISEYFEIYLKLNNE